MLLSTVFHVAMQTIIKTLPQFHVFEIVFFRSAITAACCTWYLRRHQISLKGNRQGLLILRSLFGVTAMTLFFVTIQGMPFGAAVSLKYTAPIFTAVFAVLFLKEHVRPFEWILFVTALLGVFLLKGFDQRITILYLVLGVLGAMFSGLVYVTIRKIGEADHPLVIVNYFMITGGVLAGLAMIPFWRTPVGAEWLLLLGIGVLGVFAQVFLTKGFQMEQASKVVPIKYLEVIYSLMIGLIWFGETYTWLSLLGMLIILGSLTMRFGLKQR